MIKEAISHLLARSVAGAGPAGLIKEAVAIPARYKRQKKAWTDHLNRTKGLIKEAINQCDESKSIAIIGAGACLDLPIEDLARHPAGCQFIDAVELFSMNWKVKPYLRLKYKREDVTGYLKTYQQSPDKSQLPIPQAPNFIDENTGLAISCNMLSQALLPFAPLKHRTFEDEDLLEHLIQQHIGRLKNGAKKALLITDFVRYETYKGKSERLETIPARFLPGEADQTWLWHLAPRGEINKDLDVHLKVGAWWL